MKRMFTMILLTQMGMLLLFASTALAHDGAHDGEKEDHGMYEEGSGGSAMEMDHKSRSMAHEYKEVGISNRFLKTAGFHTILIDWKAPTSELIHFLNQRISLDEQSKFLNKIHTLKKEIAETTAKRNQTEHIFLEYVGKKS